MCQYTLSVRAEVTLCAISCPSCYAGSPIYNVTPNHTDDGFAAGTNTSWNINIIISCIFLTHGSAMLTWCTNSVVKFTIHNINVILSSAVCAGRDYHCLSSLCPTSPPSSTTFAKGSASPDLSGIEVRAVVAQKVAFSSATLSILDRELESSHKGKQ